MTSPERLIEEADHCVKCGLCLPHCPTYRLSRDESESPRGRISLVQGLLCGALDGDERLWGHIDRCLGCRACEPACPSGVRYGQILDGAREFQVDSQPAWRSAWSSLLLGTLARAPNRTLTRRLLRLVQQSGMSRLAASLGPEGLRRLAGLAPPLGPTHRWRERYGAPTRPARGRVGLFTGCVSRVAEQEALLAAIRLLNRLGLDVEVPPSQACCGAIHQHAGRPREAARLARRNREAYAGRGLDAVVWVASGCGAQLADYGTLGGGPLEPSPLDVCDYLDRLEWPEDLQPASLPGRAAVHQPCTQRNALRGGGSSRALALRIPDLEVSDLPDNAFCCGAAGTYLLSQPENAERLRTPKLDALAALRPDYLLTTNVGCALHLGAGAREAGLEVEVLHPVQLLDRQIAAAGL